MELISVIIPIYNTDTYLYQCISSIINQTYSHLEIILVNDGSTDKSLEICEFFRKTDQRIKIISKPNGGLVSARKSGINASKGDFIFYLDGDDWIDADCIESYYKYARNNDIVIGDYKREFIGNFVKVSNCIPTGGYDRKRIENEIMPKMIYTGNFFQHGIRTYSWGKLYRRKIIESLQNNVPNEIVICEDAALLYPAIYNSRSIYITDIAKCNYRQRANSILKSTYIDHFELKRIALAFTYLSNTLDIHDKNKKFLHQLQAYFMAIMIIRTGAFLGDNKQFRKFNFFGNISKESKICLYNSGSFGQHVYKHLKDSKEFQLVSWLDKDYKENQIIKMNVENPNNLKYLEFDHILVASFDPQIKMQVELLFDQHGLQKHKIRNISIDTSMFSEYIESIGFNPNNFTAIQNKAI